MSNDEGVLCCPENIISHGGDRMTNGMLTAMSIGTVETAEMKWAVTVSYRYAGEPSRNYLSGVGDWALLCTGCSKTYKTAIVKLEKAAK